ncbi:MAG: SMC-Scp complex subunit ScpB [Candidatus Hadarchaeaceae archaeon]
MGAKEDLSIIEAALYVADRPLTLDELREILGTSSETYARKLVEELIAEYGKRGGPLVLAETSKGTFSLRLREEYMPKLEGVVPKARLSRGALKTLAMIAYKQPVYQARLADLRGSRVYDHIKQLGALGFIESKPFERTRVLRTSRRFAGYFGFDDDMDKIRERIEELMR